MKKYLIGALTLALGVALVSWGFKGHRAVATIAENHLNSHTKSVVNAYLAGQPMEEVSTWADELRNDPKYKETAVWHYVNLPLGLNYEEFTKAVKTQDKQNTLTALELNIHVLQHENNPIQMRIDALKFIIHLVGDAHQPMHVSRAEDKGGNTIQLRYEDKGTNLHSLWDSGLINKEGLSAAEIVKNYDTATPAEIKAWQRDEPIKWLWESYQISSKLYADAEKSKNIDDVYYNQYIPVIHKRIDQAGIRLAGLLNTILKDTPLSVAGSNVLKGKDSALTANNDLADKLKNNATKGIIKEIDVKDVGKYIGQTVVLTAEVFGLKDFGSMVLVNVGAAYPNSPLTVVLRGEAKALASTLDKCMITLTGTIIDYKGKPEIIVTDTKQIKNLGVVVGASTHKAG